MTKNITRLGYNSTRNVRESPTKSPAKDSGSCLKIFPRFREGTLPTRPLAVVKFHHACPCCTMFEITIKQQPSGVTQVQAPGV